MLGVFYGVGTILVGIFPCDPGCNKAYVDPSFSHIIHTSSGLLTYLFVPLGLVIIGLGLHKKEKNLSYLALGCGLSCFLFSSALGAYPTSNFTGVFQRLAEVSVLVWIVGCATFIKKREQISYD